MGCVDNIKKLAPEIKKKNLHFVLVKLKHPLHFTYGIAND